jgi:surface protein
LFVWWVCSFFSLMRPSLLAVFREARAFNQDVSTWNTGAVTTMFQSKCTRVLSLCWPRRLPLWCVVEDIRQLEVRRVTSLTRVLLVFALWFETGSFVVVVCVVGVVFLFFVAPFSLLAVFAGASAFNQDLSNWNTGAVTKMTNSKCAPFFPLLCLLMLQQLEVHLTFFFCIETVPLLLLLLVVLSFCLSVLYPLL